MHPASEMKHACGLKASVLLRFYVHNKTLYDRLYDSMCRKEGRRGTCDSSDLKLIHLNPSSTGILREICLSDVLPRGVEEKIWQRTFLQRLMSRPRCAYSPVMFRHKTERLGLRKDHVLG